MAPIDSIEQRKKKIKKIIPLLKRMHPTARCELEYRTPLELLVATILSAQCTDVRVNQVTKTLFKKYRKPQDYARADQEELEEDIRSTEFLVTLPGIGRKTANVILGNAFGVPGIAVDTHVGRVSGRLGLTANKDAVKVEQDLMEIVSKKQWTDFSHLLIFHGRYICTPRKPACDACLLSKYCDYFQQQLPLRTE